MFVALLTGVETLALRVRVFPIIILDDSNHLLSKIGGVKKYFKLL